MKKLIFIPFIGLILFMQMASAQTDQPKDYRNFPIIVTLQFHSLTTPFRNLKSNFRNIGIGIGTEVSYFDSPNWVQQFNILWYHNKAVGNGLMLYTQAAWRPELFAFTYGEIKAGLGCLISNRPSKSFIKNNGHWISVGRKGKAMLTLPVGISLGYQDYSEQTYLSPFISYQVMLLKGYNQTIPIVPESLLQIGTRIHSK
ncbi:MAG: hypothetical protein NW226_01685 [Microscillaceae bacterium]|nr:hypothetical protein [Microscillaceae bacterium]